MPKPYPPAKKQEALQLLAIHNDNVSIVHSLTNIPRSTLYYWRSHEPSNETVTIGKNIPSPIESVEQTESTPPTTRPDTESSHDDDLLYTRLPTVRVPDQPPLKNQSPT